MSEKSEYEKALEKARKRAKELFENVPEDIRKEFEKENVLGTPENLKDRSDEKE